MARHQVGQQPADRADEVLAELAVVLEQVGQRLRALVELPPPVAPVAAALRARGDYWTLTYRDSELLLRDSRGLQHLSRLLARPNEPVHALELVRGVPSGQRSADPDAPTRAEADAGPVLDRAARTAYRRRLAELEQEDGADEDLLLERELLEAELRRATALHGRERRLSDPAERARIAVTKAIRSALSTVLAHDAEVGTHLVRCVQTGTFCRYCVEPVVLPQQAARVR